MPLSLKWKIQLWHALILGLVLMALGTGFYLYVKHQRMKELDQWLDQQLSPLVGSPGDRPNRPDRPDRPRPNEAPQTPSAEWRSHHRSLSDEKGKPPNPTDQSRPKQSIDMPTPNGWDLIEINLPAIVGKEAPQLVLPRSRENFEAYYTTLGFYAIVANPRSGEIEFKTSNAPAIDLPQIRQPGYFVRLREGRYRELFHPNPIKAILVGADLTQFQHSLRALKWKILGTAFGILIFGSGIGYLLVAHSLKPIQSIAKTTKQISSGELNARIPRLNRGNSSELLALSDDLNETFTKLELLFDRQLRFTADASHELRTPLTALLAQLEHGQHPERTAEEIASVLKVSFRSSERIRRITEQLMELAHYDTKRVELDYEAMPLDGFLQSLIEELEPYIHQNGSEITSDLEPGSLECDPFRIHQVITNLINNALQHNDRPIQIRLKAFFDRDEAVIEIIDNGQGIRPENVEKLFDRFFQESASRTKPANQHNIGLGLSISQAIVQAHGGTLSVSSRLDLSTTFSIRLPIRPQSALN